MNGTGIKKNYILYILYNIRKFNIKKTDGARTAVQ